MRRVIFRSKEELFERASALFARRSAEAIERRGRFLVALSGGKTPRPLYERLTTEPYPREIDWPCVQVFWSDERCVPPEDPASNYRSAREALLDRVPIPAENVHRIHGELPAEDATVRYGEELETVLGTAGRFDLVLLGIGDDGHTASLFPKHEALEEAERAAVAVETLSPARVTLSLPMLNRAREVVFLVTGRGKREVLGRLDAGEDLPAARVRPDDGRLLWLVDREAAPR
ncbi:MAG: 6-phosphogluconolactonase [Candidatus Bipolaricaulota bacterium]|nr:MAG: 6-phosphogluconolactonase [Candidatus Bipolaricaulota bacterium]